MENAKTEDTKTDPFFDSGKTFFWNIENLLWCVLDDHPLSLNDVEYRPIWNSILADEPIFDESIFDGPDRIKMPIYDETEITEENNLEKI